MNFKINRYLLSISFYVAGCILVMFPVLFIETSYFIIIKYLFNTNFDLLMIFIIFIFLIIILLSDFFITKGDNLDLLTKNINFINGGKNNNIVNFILCIFVGTFEEVLFRGFPYSFLIIFKFNIYFSIILIVVFSLIFSILHITQGKLGIIFSFIISIFLFITIYITKSIWYAIIFHFLIDFIELSIVYPLQLKKRGSL